MRSTCRMTRSPRCRPTPRSSCWSAWKTSPAHSTRGSCRSWPRWPANTRWFWSPVPTAGWPPTSGRWSVARYRSSLRKTASASRAVPGAAGVSTSAISTTKSSSAMPRKPSTRRSPTSTPIRRRPGRLLHEAVGHGLEGAFNRKGSSAFSARLGQRVAAKGVTVIDDGTIVDRRGSLNIDDEGNPTQRHVLIEDGILKGYMQDSLNARLMGVAPTGNGRRESFAHLPLPRMTNTMMLAGEHDPQEIIGSVKKGIYAANFGGGQVDITSGKFVFSMSEAYLIEDGKVTRPIKGATLIGNGPDALTRVSMIGNDLQLDPGVGTCGKDGQSVPVGVGQPTLRIDGLTVGGTA